MPASTLHNRRMPHEHPACRGGADPASARKDTRLAQQGAQPGVDTFCRTTREVSMSTSPAVMALLEKKVPLTLLLDLADADHLPSRVILRRETADLSWLRPQRRRPATS
jgi:hypothetical protein